MIAIRTPKVGELSRKERRRHQTDVRISKGGARVFEDFKRIEKSFPKRAAKIARNRREPKPI